MTEFEKTDIKHKRIKMTNTALYKRISALPRQIQDELMDYMEFLIHKHKSKIVQKHPKAGCMKGTFIIGPDFNDPLEDFKEYMQ